MPSLTEDQIVEIWVKYKSRPNERLRGLILEHYLPLVAKSASRFSKFLPKSVEVEDLIGYGVFGLLEAVEAYQLDRKTSFSSFSARRIRGAMLDELRAMDWLPRQVRASARKAADAEAQLRGELNRPPTEVEISDRLGMPPAKFQELARHTRASSFVPIDAGHRTTGGAAEMRTSLPADERAVDPSREAQKFLLREMITKGLSQNERLVVILYYFEALSMKEIGKTLDLSESRVSQMHKSILQRLKAQMRRLGTSQLERFVA